MYVLYNGWGEILASGYAEIGIILTPPLPSKLYPVVVVVVVVVVRGGGGGGVGVWVCVRAHTTV